MTTPTASPLDLISAEYRATIESASFDWQVAQYIWWTDRLHEHSANEIKAAAIAVIASEQHGKDVFLEGVESYR